MKEILNLLPVEAVVGASKKRNLYHYLFAGLAVYAAVILSLWFYRVIESKKINAEIDELSRQNMELQQKLSSQRPVVVDSSVDKEILNAMEKAPRWSVVVSELSLIVPEDIWLSSIEAREDKGIKQMSVKGFSKTQLGVANLISALEASNYFYDVEIVFSQKGEKAISFELMTKLRWT